MAVLIFLTVLLGRVFSGTYAGPLEDYIAADDPSYHWDLVQTVDFDGYTVLCSEYAVSDVAVTVRGE